MLRHASGVITGLCFLALLLVAAIAEDEFVTFRPDYNHFKTTFGISSVNSTKGPQILAFSPPPGVTIRDLYTDHRTLKVIGGVLFAQTATPDSTIDVKCPTMGIDVSKPSGERGAATEVAIVSGLAPGMFARTDTTGKSTCGSGDIGNCE
jgi:hypothetical protein